VDAEVVVSLEFWADMFAKRPEHLRKPCHTLTQQASRLAGDCPIGYSFFQKALEQRTQSLLVADRKLGSKVVQQDANLVKTGNLRFTVRAGKVKSCDIFDHLCQLLTEGFVPHRH